MGRTFGSVGEILDFAITREIEASEFCTALAAEEAKHKLRFEIEYDEHVMMED